jgi:membrane protein YqaA with SNARE-associated domain
MWWQYLLVFVGAFLFDVVPFPFLPAFSIMLFLQITYHLDVWLVIVIGVAASVLGRYVLTLYIPFIADRFFKVSKNEDVQFLGKKMKEHKWKGQLVVLAYSLLPLPTTPLFLAGGMARIRALYIIPAFFIGKFTSDALALHAGKYATENAGSILQDAFSFKSIISIVLFLLLLGGLLFIDWRTLIQKKKLLLKFRIWK